ncbi:MAG: FAD-containing oxidoreductase [Verrucomicrobia bacterium]|nr:MAG: FAD-containing oxidoreductase [Verrucomicrobiota bacterium]
MSFGAKPVVVEPWDKHNQELVTNVHPPDWVNPTPAPRYNLVIIGAGTAGLVTAAGAAGLGAKVALIERHLQGGDCLNVGCVPSKCLIRSSRAVADVRRSGQFGVKLSHDPEIDFGAVMERLRRLRAGLSRHDSAKRFRDLGVDVFLGEAHFAGPDAVEVADKTLRFKKAVIATGARPVEPPVEGLKKAAYLTNETVFSLTECPRRLAVIGGGPIGCELAQAFQRLGSSVVLLHKHAHILDREDADAAEIIQQTFLREGIRLVLNCRIKLVTRENDGKNIHLEARGKTETVTVDGILVGAGRTPNVEGLNLEQAGVSYDPRLGVKVNDHLQTTNPHIYAAGDICLDWKFTHAADAAARIVIQNALFLGRKKLSMLTMPWCTYTDPEVAHVGLSEREARERGVALDSFVKRMSEVDRAIADGETEGFVKVHTRKGSAQLLGATIVARHAGEMIGEIALAMAGKLGLGTIANVIHPYPTQAEAIRKTADQWNRTRLTPSVQRLLKTWLSWMR